MFKFAIKAALCGTAVYYAKEQGIFRSAEESTKAYSELKTVVSPYVKEVTSQIPVELPSLPETDSTVTLTKQLWNRGVHATFVFLINSPQHIKNWTNSGVKKLKENEEIKKFLDSFSSSNEQTVVAKK